MPIVNLLSPAEDDRRAQRLLIVFREVSKHLPRVRALSGYFCEIDEANQSQIIGRHLDGAYHESIP